MTEHHDVHVCPGVDGYGWIIVQAGRVLSAHRSQAAAAKAGRAVARRDHVELVIHGRSGQIRTKDSYGRESARPDTER
ncbi:MAG: DUF2188 domain-containing protein [Vicinamibacterales bacterium]